jgi:DNA-binding transcriptional ArsR family regulator
MTINTGGAALDLAFAALADPTRRAILARLAQGEADVSELARPFGVSQPTISNHLKVLERAGLVSVTRDAQRRPRTLVTAPLRNIDHWLEQYRRLWEQRFARLDDYLREQQANGKPVRTPRRRRPTK